MIHSIPNAIVGRNLGLVINVIHCISIHTDLFNNHCRDMQLIQLLCLCMDIPKDPCPRKLIFIKNFSATLG
jgi:hypothetical protein